MLQQNGITANGKNYVVKLMGIICDAPDTALVACIKSQTGYFDCENAFRKLSSLKTE